MRVYGDHVPISAIVLPIIGIVILYLLRNAGGPMFTCEHEMFGRECDCDEP